MQFLCLDGGSEICSVCITRDNLVLAVRNSTGNENHAAVTAVYIEECLQEAGLNLLDLDAIVVASGPGSYTGLRVSASLAKGLCMGSGLPLIAVDSLTALAFGCPPQEELTLIIPLIDARRMDVYTAIFDAHGQMLGPISFQTLTEHTFNDLGNKKIAFCGNGIPKYKIMNVIKNAQFLHDRANATYLFKPALQRFLSNKFENIASFAPNYLHSPNITSSKKNKG